jgi:hypothetical protein
LDQCDLKIQACMAQLATRAEPPKRTVAKRRKNQPHFDLRSEQIRISGVDLCAIPGIEALTAQTVFSEVGLDVELPKTKTQIATLRPNAGHSVRPAGRRLTRGPSMPPLVKAMT